MQQLPESSAFWLVDYINQHRQKQSRYEIDKLLLAEGHNPADIELAWQNIEHPPIITYKVSQLPSIIIIMTTIIVFMYLGWAIATDRFDRLYYYFGTSFLFLTVVTQFVRVIVPKPNPPLVKTMLRFTFWISLLLISLSIWFFLSNG